MNKEKLMALGLTAEQADAVITAHNASLAGEYVPKFRFDEVNGELTTANETIVTRDGQLKTLQDSTGDIETLKTTITKLTDDNALEASNHQTALSETKTTNALKLQLLADEAGKPHDVNMVAGLFDITKIKVNDKGEIIDGYTEQRTTLGTGKSFLFEAKADPGTPDPAKPKGFNFQGTPPAEGGNPPAANKSVIFGAALAAKKTAMMGIQPATPPTT